MRYYNFLFFLIWTCFSSIQAQNPYTDAFNAKDYEQIITIANQQIQKEEKKRDDS